MKNRSVNLVVLLLLLLFGCLAISPAAATDAEPQHVWVHYDYMVFPPGSVYLGGIVYPNGVSMEPPKAAIDMVVDAFAAQGITLHIDPVHNAIPGHQVIIPDFYPAWRNLSTACAGGPGYIGLVGPDAVSFLALKQQYFHPHGDHPWHYAIFGYSAAVSFLAASGDGCPLDPHCGGPPDPTSSGMSELPGFNFIVALGTYLENTGIPLANVPEITFGSIFMHELGHNFGLEHGGVIGPGYGGVESCLAYKPNYISVMNYFYSANGIPYAAAAGSTTRIGWRLDYSNFTGLTLNEADLDESVGIGGPPGDTDIVEYCASGSAGCGLYGPSVGPIDWNNDGVIEAHAHGDIDGDDGYDDNTLHGFDDWTYLKQQLQRPPDEIDHLPKRAVP
jgi:hypothetical protein